MAALLRKRKGKAAASSSGEAQRFKTSFHEAHYKGFLAARKVLSELIIETNDEILTPLHAQITMRKWQTFTKPLQAVPYSTVRDFYANSWVPDESKRKPYSYKTMARKDFRIEEVKECLRVEGGDWVLHADRRPHYLRRTDFDPMAKGWYDFVCRSILPTTNRSECKVEIAVLIHSIIIGEEIRVEEIITDEIYKFVYKKKLSSSLPFPSTIARLCHEVKAFTKEESMIPQKPPINVEAMVRVREPRQPNQQREEAPQQQQQPPKEQPQPQVQQQDFPPTSTLILTTPCQ
ncbi:hypothetical protein PIB30_056965 [Stylosanthes scabra]|uniref:Putative plant transposon protein domain-containing protein n=1 Tax=Stylosanthes scabra TaxID=79078 RepID=A0ABU6YJP1_9FABA|nr:hypothetical protein [Stylosanthes scabra]